MDGHKPGGDQGDAIHGGSPDLYGKIKSLPVTVEAVSFAGKRIETERQTFERTIIRIQGDDATGFGEDVTRPIEAHERLREDGLSLPTGEWTIGTFSAALDTDPVRLEQTVPRETPDTAGYNSLKNFDTP